MYSIYFYFSEDEFSTQMFNFEKANTDSWNEVVIIISIHSDDLILIV